MAINVHANSKCNALMCKMQYVIKFRGTSVISASVKCNSIFNFEWCNCYWTTLDTLRSARFSKKFQWNVSADDFEMQYWHNATDATEIKRNKGSGRPQFCRAGKKNNWKMESPIAFDHFDGKIEMVFISFRMKLFFLSIFICDSLALNIRFRTAQRIWMISAAFFVRIAPFPPIEISF